MGRAGAMIGGGARSSGPGVSHGTTPGEVARFRCLRLPSPNTQIPLVQTRTRTGGKEENRNPRGREVARTGRRSAGGPADRAPLGTSDNPPTRHRGAVGGVSPHYLKPPWAETQEHSHTPRSLTGGPQVAASLSLAAGPAPASGRCCWGRWGGARMAVRGPPPPPPTPPPRGGERRLPPPARAPRRLGRAEGSPRAALPRLGVSVPWLTLGAARTPHPRPQLRPRAAQARANGCRRPPAACAACCWRGPSC